MIIQLSKLISKHNCYMYFINCLQLKNAIFHPYIYTIEPSHNKTSKMTCVPSPVWSESLLSAWRNIRPLTTYWVHSEDGSDWVDAKADPRLHWAHTEGHLVGFVVGQLIFLFWGVSSIQPSLALLLHKHIKIYFTCNCIQGMTLAQ